MHHGSAFRRCLFRQGHYILAHLQAGYVWTFLFQPSNGDQCDFHVATWMTQMGWSFRSTCRHQLALVHLHTQFGSSLTHRDDIVLPESGHR
ncbi:hypothetical protein ABBQ38_010785 [Trebouxia sp. C0009 RCD-2024]